MKNFLTLQVVPWEDFAILREVRNEVFGLEGELAVATGEVSDSFDARDEGVAGEDHVVDDPGDAAWVMAGGKYCFSLYIIIELYNFMIHYNSNIFRILKNKWCFIVK